ncbi:hypothetical protein BKA65DRAFT_549296 [Rhexocercosporidium sp. MPI-PUGE-AT-0058]|nr:hypothetical protein BKA65DRAFT_549296 [Rhexocercosporidium sp. MPI-PUGE-AT-0058]
MFAFLSKLAEDKHFKEIYCCDEAWPDEAISDSFSAFMDSTWWKRLWVVQEAILPMQAVVFFGIGSLDWDIIMAAAAMAYKHLTRCRDAWRDMNNPLDKVYALLGLVSNIPEDLEPDYSLTKREVYRKITLLSIRETRLLHILKGQRFCVGEIPAWIYDWSLVRDEKSWVFGLTRLSLALYNASGGEEAMVSDAGELNLSLAGVCIDHMVAIGEPYALGIGSIEGGGIVYSWYEMVKKFYSQGLTFQDMLLRNTWYQKHVFGLTLKAGLRPADSDQQISSLDEICDFKKWWSYVQNRQFHQLEQDEGSYRFDATLLTMATDRAFFITKSGYMGLGRPQEGDEIWVLLGGDLPFVLRPVPGSDEYYLVGDCYLHEAMDGEALVDLEKRRRTVVLR